MPEWGRRHLGLALILLALGGFITALAISPRRRVSAHEVAAEALLPPSFTPAPSASPTITATPAPSQTPTPSPNPTFEVATTATEPPSKTPYLMPSATLAVTQPATAATATEFSAPFTATFQAVLTEISLRQTQAYLSNLTATATRSIPPTIPEMTAVAGVTQLAPSSTPAPAPDVLFELDYPEKVELGRSDTIRVTLRRAAEGPGTEWTATVEDPAHAAIAASAQPVGTAGAPPEGAFGPGYVACAVASLQGQGFEISEVTPGCRPLDQERLTWEWNLRPRSDALGPQVINLRIEGRWESLEPGRVLERELFRANLRVEVSRPLLSYLNFGSLVSGILGSGLSIPWWYERIKESREKQKKKREEEKRAARRRRR